MTIGIILATALWIFTFIHYFVRYSRNLEDWDIWHFAALTVAIILGFLLFGFKIEHNVNALAGTLMFMFFFLSAIVYLLGIWNYSEITQRGDTNSWNL